MENLYKGCAELGVMEPLIKKQASYARKNKDEIDRFKKDMGYLIMFHTKLTPAVAFDKLMLKLEYFKNDKEILASYLTAVLNAITEINRNVAVNSELEILLNLSSLKSTRFVLFEYCFNELGKELPPSRIVKLFLPRPFSVFAFGTNEYIQHETTKIALFKLWVSKNNKLFIDKTKTIDLYAHVEENEATIFVKDLKQYG